MAIAPTYPKDELARLATLHECSILDTPPEPTYDELARLATFVCDTPMGTITLIDEQRQWFKARLNLEPRETPRNLAFCAFTILTDDVLVIEDAAHDDRFATNPLVTSGPRIRFYAGAPLVMPNGQRIGTVAVMDVRPRQLRAAQLDALRAVAHQVVAQLELRRVFEEGARFHNERFRVLAKITNDAVWDWDMTTNVVWCSDGLTTLFGLSPSSINTIEDWIARVHSDDVEAVERSLHEALRTRQEVWSADYRFRRSDGAYADVLDRAHVMYAQDTPVRLIGAMLDQTKHRRLELELRQSQKMEALGQLSGGVAHDFNNILTVIQANTAMIARATKLDTCLEHAEQIGKAAERAATLTRQLLLLSRKQVMRMRVVELNDVVRDMSRMLERILPTTIRISVECRCGLPSIRADVCLLEQVLLNLAVNARDAMPDGGQLTIETGHARPDVSRPRDVAEGPCIFVRVSDTGTGMTSDVQAHIFEPFFTTKEIGKGTGLGLATVYGIVRQHGGWIDVSSELGKGSSFSVYIPTAADAELGDKRETSTRGNTAALGTETIMVVEDDEAVRRGTVALLQSHGYNVIAVGSGAEAWAQWPHVRDQVRLVMTDLVMPGGVGGKELAARAVADKPGTPVIYTSGYAAHDDVSDELIENVNFLAKPYPPELLARVVRAALDQARRTA